MVKSKFQFNEYDSNAQWHGALDMTKLLINEVLPNLARSYLQADINLSKDSLIYYISNVQIYYSLTACAFKKEVRTKFDTMLKSIVESKNNLRKIESVNPSYYFSLLNYCYNFQILITDVLQTFKLFYRIAKKDNTPKMFKDIVKYGDDKMITDMINNDEYFRSHIKNPEKYIVKENE